MKFIKKIPSWIFKTGPYLLIILPVIFLAIIMIEFFIERPGLHISSLFTEDDYYWFFSTAAQAMAALFGIGGMFAAFVLQIINNKYDKNFEDFRKASHSFLGSSYADEELLKKMDEQLLKANKEIKKWISYDKVKRVRKNISRYDAKRKDIKIAFRTMMVFMASVVVMSLLALPLSTYLASTDFGLIFGIFFLILMLVTVLKLVRFIFISIKD